MATPSIADKPLTGSCACKTIAYSLLATPLITHCCHCTACQRETGSAFGINTVVETSNFKVHQSSPPLVDIDTPSASGKGQHIIRCPKCFVALYSHYGGSGKVFTFVRAGTLDDSSRNRVRPDVHIYTKTKMHWVNLDEETGRGAKIFDEFYDAEEVWSDESLARRNKAMMKDAAGRS